MSTELIERKLAEIERRLEAVEAKTFDKRAKGAWKEIIGWEQDDDLFREAVRLGAEWRAKANVEGR